MDCLECKRLWQSYADATKQSIDIVVQVANNLKITGTRGAFSEASMKADAEWTTARESLYAHIANHSGVAE